MSVWCNACGRLSQDSEFCDYCNADLGTAGDNLPPARCPVSEEGVPLTLQQREMLAVPEASAIMQVDDRTWRVHWISQAEWESRGPVLEKRLSLAIPSLPPGRIIEDVRGRWLAFDARAENTPVWTEVDRAGPLVSLPALSLYVHSLALALESLHRQELVCLRFDPNALEDVGLLEATSPSDGSAEGRTGARMVRFTNLDVELFSFRSMPERVRVQPQFAAPEIVQFRVEEIGPRTDVFHLAIFTYYWLAGLLPHGMPGDGLEQFDYELPFLRIYAPMLPVGILPVIRRGLAASPRARQPTPREFADDLARSIEQGRARMNSTQALKWDIGGHTRTGRAKAEARRVNEDTILTRECEGGTVIAVADGVSTCDIGSGALASMMTAVVLENTFADGCTHENFPALVATVSQTGSQRLLDWAISSGCRADLEAGKDLMGTTLTIGWLEGHEVSLANLGDSRAYLISGDAIEQLTVDGDLASDLLAQGASPQEVRELGAMARALRECIGGCTKNEEGELCSLPDSANPKVRRWPLLPGDVLVLCSDGLVEEGYFLEPAAVHEIVARHRDLSAADLALKLVETADALQRAPTPMEPEGFGDNISCIVVKIMEDSSS